MMRSFRVAGLLFALSLPGIAGVSRAALPPAPAVGQPAEYVIVTNQSLAPEFARLARWKNRLGIPAVVQTVESIRATYPAGRDDAERVRLFLQDARATWNTRWVLLGGDASVVPVRYAWTFFYGGWDLPTDLYYSCLDGTWNADGDDRWGEGFQSSADPGDDADLAPDVALGRAPVRTPAEARVFVDKAIQAGFEPIAPASHGVLLAAQVLFPQGWTPGTDPTFDGADITETLLPHFAANPDVHVARLYQNQTNPFRPGSLPLTHARFVDSLAAGYDFVVHAGWGDSTGLGTGDAPLVPADVAGLANGRRSVVYSLAGGSATLGGESIGRAFLLAPQGGATAFIAGTVYGFPTASRVYVEEFVHQVYDFGVSAVGEAFANQGLPFLPYMQYDGVNRWTQMTITLLGDPELRLYVRAGAPLTLSAPEALAVGSDGFDVSVSAGGAPVANARVSAWCDDEQLVVATTDADGRAHVPFGVSHPGTCELTVTTTGGERATRSIAMSTPLGGDAPVLAAGIRLARPVPNPASGPLRIAYEVGQAVRGRVTLAVFDASGRHVRTLADEDTRAGRFEVTWDLRSGAGVPVRAGLYFLRLRGADREATQRTLVTR